MKISNNFIFFFILSLFSYVFSLILFGKIVLPIYENLTYWPPHYKVFGEFYRTGESAFNIFLAGNIKWHYYIPVIQPITLFTLILDTEYFIYFLDIAERALAFYFCYVMVKKMNGNRRTAAIIALFYSTILHIKIIFTLPHTGLCFLPYLFYLLSKDKNLNFKHYFIILLAGLSSSPNLEFGIFLVFPLAYYLVRKRNIKNLLFTFLFFGLGFIISVSPLIYSIINEEIHRVDQINSFASLEFLSISFANIFSLFQILKYLIFFSIIYISIIYFDRDIKIIYFHILITLLIIIFESELRLISGFVNSVFVSFNWERIENIFPFFSVLLLAKLNKRNLKNIFSINSLNYSVLIISIILQMSLSLSVIFANVKNSLLTNKRNLVEKIQYNTELNGYEKIIETIKIVIDRNNFGKEINFFVTNKSYKEYYKFEEYSQFKKVVGGARVASIGIDPMIAVMNDINVIDGYHNLYPKSYKMQFREIIKEEIEANKKIFNFDSWGNQVYIFYNDPNNLKINFEKIKEIGADYIISTFEINKKSLELKDTINHMFLYYIK